MEGLDGVVLSFEDALKELDNHIAFAEQQIQAYGNRGGESDLFNQVREKFQKGFESGNFTLEQAKNAIDEIMGSRNER